MNVILEILFYVFCSIGASYLLLIAAFNVAWFRIGTWQNTGKVPVTKVTVIVPARNESENIIQCLENICNQNYPASLYEIIVVDDSSNDNTVELVKRFISGTPSKNIIIAELEERKTSFKKQAISEAIHISKGDLIITTDADCTMPANWIASLVDYYQTYKPALIIGPVSFSNEQGWFQKMQTLEFLSLIASGAASVHLGIPTMCNGANLIYEKDAFTEAGGFESGKKFASGDDVFLMHKIKTLKRKIAFIKCSDALVVTAPQPSFLKFINQRKRWVSKSPGYTDIATIATALNVFLFNLSMLASLVLSFFCNGFLWLFLLCFLLKMMIDFPILFGIASFVKKRKIMFLFIPLQVIYPVYIVFIAIMGFFGKFEWKDRVYSVYE